MVVTAFYRRWSQASSTSPIMPLEDLVEHSPAQIEAIKKCFEIFPPKDSCPLLDMRGAEAWGTGLEFLQNEEPVERDSDPVDDILALPDSIPCTRPVVTPPEVQSKLWRLPEPRILTRSDYYEAERAAMTANEVGKDVFVVAGHPGIGSPPTLTLTPSAHRVQCLIRKVPLLALASRAPSCPRSSHGFADSRRLRDPLQPRRDFPARQSQ